jgi:hypothetical protein
MANRIVCGWFLVLAGAILLGVSGRLELISPLILISLLMAFVLFPRCAKKTRLDVANRG